MDAVDAGWGFVAFYEADLVAGALAGDGGVENSAFVAAVLDGLLYRAADKFRSLDQICNEKLRRFYERVAELAVPESGQAGLCGLGHGGG